MSLTKFAKTYAANQSKYAHLNAFITRPNSQPFVDRQLANVENGDHWDKLDGKPVAVKDNICTKDFPTTAASGMLKGFTSPYDATVVELLRGAGAEVVGKTNMDEFGMGSHSTHSHAGPVVMERYPGEAASAGGSSGGSAVAVATGQCWAALGTDTGGSVRLPAAYTGTIGFKPSYGLLSRWGVIDYANSLDTVGIVTANASGARDVFAKLNVHDPKDPTSLPPPTRARLEKTEWDGKRPLRIGIPLDYNISTLDPVVRSAWLRALKHLAERNHTLHPVRLPATQHALSAYYILAPAEASSNLAKYDGVRFGTRADGIDGSPESVLFAKTRGQGFGSEVQRRILLGAFSLSAQAIDNYFIQAQKIRRLVQRDFDNVFAKPNPLRTNGSSPALLERDFPEEKVDVLLCPTAPTLAPSLAEVKDQDPLQAYMNDVFTVPASLAGLPAVSVPIRINAEDHRSKYGDHEFPAFAGMQVIGQYGDDDLVLQVGHNLRRTRGHGRCTEMNQVRLDPNAWGFSRFLEEAVKAPESKDHAFPQSVSIPDSQEAMDAESSDQIRAESKEEIHAELGALLNATVGEQRIAEGAKFYALPQDQYIRQLSESEDPLSAEAELYKKVQASKPKAGNRLEKPHAVRTVLDSQTAGTKTRIDRYHRNRGIENFKNRQKSLLKDFEKEHTGEEVEAFKAMQEEELKELEARTTEKAIRFVGSSSPLVKRIRR